jgi:hypothetical protein
MSDALAVSDCTAAASRANESRLVSRIVLQGRKAREVRMTVIDWQQIIESGLQPGWRGGVATQAEIDAEDA